MFQLHDGIVMEPLGDELRTFLQKAVAGEEGAGNLVAVPSGR